MRLVLLGKPGSGKGTQSKFIAGAYSIPAISTGDLIRAAIGEGTELGRRFKTFTDSGLLVPDELVVAMVGERLSKGDCARGFLLDGFPRTIPQAEALERLLAERGLPLDCALNIEVPDELLVERSAGRWWSPDSGATYHVRFNPPRVPGMDDATGKPLVQRDDDRPDVVRARVAQYREKTEPLLAFYKERGLLAEVNGVGALEEVTARVRRALDAA